MVSIRLAWKRFHTESLFGEQKLKRFMKLNVSRETFRCRAEISSPEDITTRQAVQFVLVPPFALLPSQETELLDFGGEQVDEFVGVAHQLQTQLVEHQTLSQLALM